MPTETKNSTAKASRRGRDSSAARWLRRSGQDHAGKEGAQRDGDAEQFRRREGHAQRHRQDRQPEEFAASGMGDIMQHRRDHAPSHQQHQGRKDRQLAEGERQRLGHH